MAYDINHLATVGQLKTVATRIKEGLDDTIKSLSVSGNTISFFTSEDGSGTAAYTVDFPAEMFLDQTQTKFESSFAFTTEKYTGATNPNLDGKPVMVLAVKSSNGTSNVTMTYSFLDMSTLVDTYTVKTGDSAKVLGIEGNELEFKISPDEDNALAATANGLKVSISDKADKVVPTTAGNIPSLNASGELQDSGVSADNIIQKSNISTDAEVTEMLTEVFGS